jgi:hypothetical protein
VSQVQVSFRALFQDIDFAVLIGAHGAWIDVDVGVEFLDGHSDVSRFENATDSGSRDAFAKATHNSAGHKYELGHIFPHEWLSLTVTIQAQRRFSQPKGVKRKT